MNIDLTSLLTLKNMIIAGAGSTLLALLTGKTFRRLLLLPFKKLAEKTKTDEDDLLIKEAARDLGLPEDAGPEKEDK
jgi:hypothetical protein